MNKIVLAITATALLSTSAFSIPQGKPGHKSKASERRKAKKLKQEKQDKWELDNYLPLTSCEKQNILWQKMIDSEHKKLPNYSKLGVKEVFGLGTQTLSKKMNKVSDFAPIGWKKYLHKRGVVSKVKFKAIGEHSYTGFFKGAECALLRLSLTYKPTYKKAFAPGLALKVLRDGNASGNISALYTLSGQGRNYNFFENPLSNIVPKGHSIGEKLIHLIFSRVSKYPEQLNMQHMAEIMESGKVSEQVVAPRQIFFVPNEKINFPKDKHDMREDLLSLKEGTTLYKVYAVARSEKYENFYSYNIKDIQTHLADAKLIGEITTTSKFIASEFGDTGLFFKHQKADVNTTLEK